MGEVRHFRVSKDSVSDVLKPDSWVADEQSDGCLLVGVSCVDMGEYAGLPLYITPTGICFTYESGRQMLNVIAREVLT